MTNPLEEYLQLCLKTKSLEIAVDICQDLKCNIKDINKEKTSTQSRMFSQSSDKQNIPSINQILQSNDPYLTFDLTQDTTCDEIKSKYKELCRMYNASYGSDNKTHEERELLNRTQSRINIAYDFLRKKHCELYAPVTFLIPFFQQILKQIINQK